jgi:predicted alpha/beta-hydrolase family hydrolase
MDLLTTGPKESPVTIVLAHGAGAPMDSPFMNTIADGLTRHNMRVARFEFPYMRQQHLDGKRRGPDPLPKLQATWREVIASLGTNQLVIGGKSMGGRVASMLADELGVRGLVCLGYPFHPPGKPTKQRIAHLHTLRTRTLIVQGTRDVFGALEEVATYELSSQIELLWLEDGDHSFKPRVKSGRTLEQNLGAAIAAIAAFAVGLERESS